MNMDYKVLIVDDDKDIVEFLHLGLSRQGYEVVSAFDGEEALVKVREEDPHIILLDLIMPKLNGFDVLKEVRAKYNQKWKPVIIISANTELESLKQCYDLKADHYLTKPVSLEKILQGIETMISLMPLHID